MGYRLLADATMAVHFAFLGYVVAGGFLAWRWPRAIWPHLALAGWGFSTLVFHQECPLSVLEDWARRQAGEPGLVHPGLHRDLPHGRALPGALGDGRVDSRSCSLSE